MKVKRKPSCKRKEVIRPLSQCPYCTTQIAFAWPTKELVFNPDTGHSVCTHVVWVDGTLVTQPEANTHSKINFRWTHPQFSELDSNAALREYLSDTEMAATVGVNGEWICEFEIDAQWECDLPTIHDESGILDVFMIYAADPAAFLAACKVDMEKNPRPVDRGPLVDWCHPFVGLHDGYVSLAE